MRKLFGLVALCLCFFIFAGNVEASCNAFRVAPPSGTTSDTFVIYAEDCTDSIYFARINNNDIVLSRQTSNPPHIYTGSIRGSQLGVTTGQQTIGASLLENGIQIATTSFVVRVSTETTPPNPSVPPTGPLGQENCADEELATAIGCIPVGDVNVMARFFLGWALGIAGGVALLMIGLASYRIATSQGDPRRLQGGQELLMSAIGGLLMVVLSVYLLRFIGVDLLGIF